MNKKQIDEYIPKAYEALKTFGVAKENEDGVLEIKKTFRGYIAAFGAAIIMGSLRSAIAFNSAQNGAEHPRENLMKILYFLITGSEKEQIESVSLLNYVISNKEREKEIKEQIYNAAIATKLAMNMYFLAEEKDKEKNDEVKSDEVHE
jgi:hypothetical protein